MSDYLDNGKFTESIVEYQQKCIEAEKNNLPVPRITEEIGKSILLLANNLAHRPNFSQYTYIDQMISAAIESCLRAVRKFDVNETTNAFAYFTTCAWYAFLNVMRKEEYQSYVKAKCFYDNESTFFELENDDDYDVDSNYQPFFDVGRFEEKAKQKKLDAKAKSMAKNNINNNSILDDLME